MSYAGTYSCRSVKIGWVLILVGPTALHKVDLLNRNTHWEIPAKHKMSRVTRNFELEKWELGNEFWVMRFECWDMKIELAPNQTDSEGPRKSKGNIVDN